MRIELTRVGLLVYFANHYTTRGAIVVKRVASVAHSISTPYLEAVYSQGDNKLNVVSSGLRRSNCILMDVNVFGIDKSNSVCRWKGVSGCEFELRQE